MGNQNAIGHELSEESKQQMIETKKKNGTYGWSDARKKDYLLNKRHWTLSEETKQKMSESMKGVEKSEKHKASLSDAQLLRFSSIPLTDELKFQIIYDIKSGMTIHACSKKYNISDYRIKKYIIPDVEEAEEI